jgi:hypothetical protein
MQICDYISLTKSKSMKAQPQTKDMRIGARVTEKEYNKITKLAKQHKLTVAEYVRQSALSS